MSRFISSIRARQIKSRDSRAIARIVDGVGSSAMREELIIMAQHSATGTNR